LTTCRCRIRHHEEVHSRAVPAEVGQLVSSARRRAGLSQRALAERAGTSQAAIARYETGRHVPDLRTLTRLVAACGLELSLDVRPADAPDKRRGRSGSESAVVRPVAVPGDVDDPAINKASGIVELPERVRWSGPPRTYDLSDRQDRARVYEQVLREGSDDDVRRFIRLDDLADLWDDLLVPGHVRDAWEPKLRGHARKPD
jgi:transcriptional regulator with XRE-family HTH domain